MTRSGLGSARDTTRARPARSWLCGAVAESDRPSSTRGRPPAEARSSRRSVVAWPEHRRGVLVVFQVVGDHPHRRIDRASREPGWHRVRGQQAAFVVSKRVVVGGAVLVVEFAPVTGVVPKQALGEPLPADLSLSCLLGEAGADGDV